MTLCTLDPAPQIRRGPVAFIVTAARQTHAGTWALVQVRTDVVCAADTLLLSSNDARTQYGAHFAMAVGLPAADAGTALLELLPLVEAALRQRLDGEPWAPPVPIVPAVLPPANQRLTDRPGTAPSRTKCPSNSSNPVGNLAQNFGG